MARVQKLIAIMTLCLCFNLILSRTVPVDDTYDQDTAATDHHYGRVHIKVFRGPSHHHHFAPHGYWIKQPADDEHHH